MGGHLGPGEDEVHDAAQAVLRFWFGELTPEQQFAEDGALDATITERFAAMRDDVLAGDALGWRGEPEHLLAAVILLDQFSRNIHRESSEAYAADPLALSLAEHGIERGWHRTLPPEQAVFLLTPLMHAESRDAATRSVALYRELGREEQIDFAQKHAAVIEQFGHYPSRNAALGRESTAEETAFLSRSGAGW